MQRRDLTIQASLVASQRLTQTASIARNVNMASDLPYYQYFCSVTPAAMGDHSLQVAFRPEGSSDVFVPVSVPVTIKVTPGLPDFDKTEVLGLGVGWGAGGGG